MQGFAYSLLWAVAAAQPVASSEAPLSLAPGEAVTLHISDDGEASAGERREGRMTPYLEAAANRLWKPDGSYTVGSIDVSSGSGGMPPAEPVTQGEVRMTFAAYPPGQRVLVVENGYDRALVYRARLWSGGRRHSTTVCLVQPAKRTLEHWPYAIEAIEIDRLRLEPWEPGTGRRCR